MVEQVGPLFAAEVKRQRVDRTRELPSGIGISNYTKRCFKAFINQSWRND
jgi:hypothetical protein